MDQGISRMEGLTERIEHRELDVLKKVEPS